MNKTAAVLLYDLDDKLESLAISAANKSVNKIQDSELSTTLIGQAYILGFDRFTINTLIFNWGKANEKQLKKLQLEKQQTEQPHAHNIHDYQTIAAYDILTSNNFTTHA